jgi:hypothetical protein
MCRSWQHRSIAVLKQRIAAALEGVDSAFSTMAKKAFWITMEEFLSD